MKQMMAALVSAMDTVACAAKGNLAKPGAEAAQPAKEVAAVVEAAKPVAVVAEAAKPVAVVAEAAKPAVADHKDHLMILELRNHQE